MQRTGTSASNYIFTMRLRMLVYQSETYPVTQLS